MAFGDFTVDRNSTKYVLGSGGTIVSYPTDEPAFEFNADGTYKGLLVEPAATNLFTQSDGSNWSTSSTNSEVTRTLNADTSPDGTTNATGIKSISGNTQAILRGPAAERSFTSGTFSIYAKSDGRDFVYLNIRSAGGSARAWFDLVNGTLGTVDAGNTGSILSVGNGWYRCSIYRATAIDEIQIGIADTDNSISITDDDTIGLFVYGLQMEEGSPIATSLIPTSGSTVTRVKDNITQTGAQSLIGQTEGTLYVEVDWKSSGDSQYFLEVSDGTNDNRISIRDTVAGELRMFVESNNLGLVDQGVSSSGYSGIQKIAFAYAESDFELYRNGSSISTDTTGSLASLATLTDIDLGQALNADAQANMHIRAVAIYPTRLSDAECEALTTL